MRWSGRSDGKGPYPASRVGEVRSRRRRLLQLVLRHECHGPGNGEEHQPDNRGRRPSLQRGVEGQDDCGQQVGACEERDDARNAQHADAESGLLARPLNLELRQS